MRDNELLKNIIIFGIKLAIAWNQIREWTYLDKKFMKSKIKSYHDEATYFDDKKMPKTGSYLLSSNNDWFCS